VTTHPKAPAAKTPAAGHDWWRGAAIYQVYPRSFADSNGDGVGDLAGITARLDHIASLGVDAIWLSPFYTSPMRDFGYDVANHQDVDPIFGDLADFDRLIARAHELGLKLIIDLVYSHTSDEHPWFTASRADRTNDHANWYVWADPNPDGSPPSNWQSVFGGPSWTWDARRKQYYLHNFLTEQPDLNVHNRDVQDALLAITAFWLERGVDGFRLDAINFAMHDPALTDNPPMPNGVGKRTRPFDYQRHVHDLSHKDVPAFLARLRALTDAHGGGFMVAEVVGENATRDAKLYTAPGHLHSAYSFHYLYADKLDAKLVRKGLALWPGGADEGWPSWTFSNHDAPRAVSRWAPLENRKAEAEMNLLLLTALRGNIFIYQGEELGLPQAEVPFERLQDPEAIANWPQTLGRDGARTPMPWINKAPHAGFSDVEPWLPVDPAHAELAVDVQDRDPHSTLNVARRILRLRQTHVALRTGALHLHDTPDPTSDPLLVFERGEGSDRVLCAFNLGSAPVAWTLPDGWRVIEAANTDASDTTTLPARAGVLAVRA